MARLGRTVEIDWRWPGGTAEITRYLASEYAASFQRYWTRDLGRPVVVGRRGGAVRARRWTARPTWGRRRGGLRRVGRRLRRRPALRGRQQRVSRSTRAPAAWSTRAWARATRALRRGRHPADVRGRDVLGRARALGGHVPVDLRRLLQPRRPGPLGVARPPSSWPALADPVFRNPAGLRRPTKSGSVGKAFETLVQNQMNEARQRAAATGETDPAALDRARRTTAWAAAVRLIRRIGANARYFTDSGTKVPLDVSQGEAAAACASTSSDASRASTPAPRGDPGAWGFARRAARRRWTPIPSRCCAGAPPRARHRLHGVRVVRGGAEAVGVPRRHAGGRSAMRCGACHPAAPLRRRVRRLSRRSRREPV